MGERVDYLRWSFFIGAFSAGLIGGLGFGDGGISHHVTVEVATSSADSCGFYLRRTPDYSRCAETNAVPRQPPQGLEG